MRLRRAQPAFARHHRAHQLVGVQAAFHEALGPPLADQPHAFLGRCVAMRCIDDLESRDIEAVLVGDCFDPTDRAN